MATTPRISYTIPSKEPLKKASVRQIKKYKRLIDLLISIVASEPPITGDGYPKGKIAINWREAGPPEWFCKPLGRYNKLDSREEVLYNACRVLLCLYENGYTDYTPSKIFRERRAFLMQNTILENELESLLDIDIKEDYNVD